MEKKQRSSSPIMWALKQTGEHRGRYVVSVVFAVVGVAFSLAPYFVIVDIVNGLMNGNKEFSLLHTLYDYCCSLVWSYTISRAEYSHKS